LGLLAVAPFSTMARFGGRTILNNGAVWRAVSQWRGPARRAQQ